MSHVPRRPASTMSFDDQLVLFLASFPGGFGDPRWAEEHRGEHAKKRLRSHRDPAIAEAREKLSARSLKERMASEQFQSVYDDICGVLERTDLVPRVELALLADADPPRQRAIVQMVMELLHGKGTFGPRFDRFLAAFQAAMKKPVAWQLATTLVALMEPAEHISLRPTAFRAQLKLTAPHVVIPKLPNAASYLRSVSVAKLISTKLTEHGRAPRDLFDVLDFVHLTTGPEARKRLSAIKRAE